MNDDAQTLGTSTIFRLCEELIALRETNNRQHKVFEQSLTRAHDANQNSLNTFMAETQRAYQQLRQELHGEKRISLALLNELLEVGMDLQQITAARPSADDAAGLARWGDAIEVEGARSARRW